MQISFTVNDSQKNILFILAINGPTEKKMLDYLFVKLSDMNEMVKTLFDPYHTSKYRLLDADEFVRETAKDGADVSKMLRPTSFVNFLEYFNGAPSLKLVIELLKHNCTFDNYSSLFAPIGCPDISDDLATLRVAGLITAASKPSRFNYSTGNIELTAEGQDAAKRLSSGRSLILKKPAPRQRTVFMACSFGREDVEILCESEIKPACIEVGANYHRIDSAEPSTTITDAILNSIRGCSAMVADLTYSRPSVYFEAGFALSLGLPVLLTCREDHYNSFDDEQKIHFDLAQFKISFWKRESGLGFVWKEGMTPRDRLKRLLNMRSSVMEKEI